MKTLIFSNTCEIFYEVCVGQWQTGELFFSFTPLPQELFRLDQLATQSPGSRELTLRTNGASDLRNPSASASQVRAFPGRAHRALLFSFVSDDS